jgi:hypothetical protein
MRTLITISLSLTLLAGYSGVDFLKIGVGARSASLGGAYTGIAEGGEASYWNPAGLVQIERIELTGMHLQWSTDLMYEYLGYGHKFPGLGTFGLSIIYFSLGNFDARDDYGLPLPAISAYDACVTLSYARSVIPALGIGLNLKGIQEKIGSDNAAGFAADLGGLYSLDKLRFGLCVQNLGMKMKYADEEFALPMTIQAGVSFLPMGSSLVLALGGDYQVENSRGNVRLGAEYWIQGLVALRAGYQYATKDDQLNMLGGLRMGLGVKKSQFGFDYGYEPSQELGDIHRLSLKVSL